MVAVSKQAKPVANVARKTPKLTAAPVAVPAVTAAPSATVTKLTAPVHVAKDGAVKGLALRPGQVHNLAPSLIKVEQGYNVRRWDAAIEEDKLLAESIRRLGVETPLTVRQDKPGAPVMLVSGHRRLAAVQWLASNGKVLDSVPVLLDETALDEQSRTLNLLVSNSGKPLTPIEQATVVTRLRKLGWTDKKIAEHAGFSPRYIQILARMAAMPESVAQAVYADTLSATLADTVLLQGKLKGFDAAEVLSQAIREQAAKARFGDKLNVTKKHVEVILARQGKTLATAPAPVAPAAPAPVPSGPAVPNAAALADVANLRAKVAAAEAAAKAAKPGKESKTATAELANARTALDRAVAAASAVAEAESKRPAGVVTPGGAVAAGKPAAATPVAAKPAAALAFRRTGNVIAYATGSRSGKVALTATHSALASWLEALMNEHADTMPILD